MGSSFIVPERERTASRGRRLAGAMMNRSWVRGLSPMSSGGSEWLAATPCPFLRFPNARSSSRSRCAERAACRQPPGSPHHRSMVVRTSALRRGASRSAGRRSPCGWRRMTGPRLRRARLKARPACDGAPRARHRARRAPRCPGRLRALARNPEPGRRTVRTRTDGRGSFHAAPAPGLSVAGHAKSTGSSRQRSNAVTGRWGIPAGGRYAHIGP